MHQEGKPASTAAQDNRDERAAYCHIMEAQPATLRVSDLIRELAEGEDFVYRDRVERAIHELTNAGLLFRHGGAVLPTRAAIRAYELLDEAA
jgi:DeoR/GlpR family transcriptional regulator of sugar metabolism